MDDRRRVTLGELFLGFAHLGVVSFGGAIVWARRLLVVERGWLTDREFDEVIGLGQILPGPNVVNASVVIGAREGGPLGALVALAGLLLPPLALVLAAAALLAPSANAPSVSAALHGSALAGAGLVLATGLSMARRLPREMRHRAIALATLSLLLLGWPLPAIVATVVPAGIVLVALRERRAA